MAIRTVPANPTSLIEREGTMAWKELFSTDIGLLSLFTIGFILVMGGYLYRFAKRHMAEDEQRSHG
jgi:hypothetical protein